MQQDKDFGFQHFMTPRVIGLAWILLLVVVVGSLISNIIIPWYLGRDPWAFISIQTIAIWVVGLIVTRFVLEFLSIVFAIHERLTDILEELRRSPAHSAPPPSPTTHPARPKLYSAPR